MKTKRKVLLLAISAVAIVIASVFGTLAYLTDTATVTNTFTVGQVHIILDEVDVDNDKNTDDNRTVNNVVRDRANAYKLLPGGTYDKDPMVTVLGGSSESYVRMLVTIHNIDGAKAAFPDHVDSTTGVFLLQDFVNNTWDSKTWIYKSCKSVEDSADDVVYEFWYKEKVAETANDLALPALFTQIKVPNETTNDDIAKLYYEIGTDGKLVKNDDGSLKALDETERFKIDVVAHAIQAEGFASADEAWAAWQD